MDFGSLNMENIDNILSSMSSEDMEMLSEMAQNLFSSMGKNEDKTEKAAPPPADSSPFSPFNIDMATLGRIMRITEKLRSRPEDPGCRLLQSLRPMVSERRQGKIDEAIKMLSLLSFLPMIDELRGNGNE
ncbi:MAG: hypothetical protein IJO73_00165 [Clostridia bacterium]|nr:hypothetical protein [Clostridia bacterium]